jgi:hypothetical protein
MIIVGIVSSVFGIGFFCWLLFTLAVYALPFFAGLSAGLTAFHSGSGVVGALIVGVLTGGATAADPRGDRATLCRARRHCRLPCDSRTRAYRHAVRSLA